MKVGPGDSRTRQILPAAITPLKGSPLKQSWLRPHGDSGSSGKSSDLQRPIELFKLLLNYFIVTEKGKKEGTEEGGRDGGFCSSTHSSWPRGK